MIRWVNGSLQDSWQAIDVPRQAIGRTAMGDFVERTIGELTVRIDRGTCIGTANCMKVAPDLFDFDGENICAFTGEPAGIERERLIEACRVCPVDALIVTDATGNQLVP